MAALAHYTVALSQNHRAIADKKRSGDSQFIYICNSSTPCTFEIVLAKSRRKVSNHIVVKSLSMTHDNCTGTAKARRKDVTSKPVAQNAVNASMRISGASLQYQVKADAGIDLNKRTAYRVIDDLVQLKYGNFEAEYKKVASFLEEFAAKNLTPFTAFEACDGKFHRAFLMNPHSGRIQPNCQKIVGTDGAHTKHKLHEGKMLILIARDGDNKNAVLAVALCPSEDRDNYNRFIECCKNDGIVFNNVPLFCDRGVALVSTTTSHNDLTLIHCVRHIIGNVKKQYKKTFTTLIEGMIYNLQGVASDSGYNSKLGILKSYNEDVHEYVIAIKPSAWCLYPSIEIRSLYGWQITNFVESENSTPLKALFLLSLHFLMAYVDKMIIKRYERRQKCKEWIGDGNILTPYAKVCNDAERENMTFYTVQPATSFETYVWHCQRYPIYKTCTCMYCDRYRMPCRSIMAFLSHFNCLDEIFDYYEDCYKVANYAQLHSEDNPIRNPIDQELQSNNILPPLRITTLGRAKMEKI